MSRNVSGQSMRRVAVAFAARERQAARRSPPTRGTCSASKTSASDLLVDLERRDDVEPTEHVASAGEHREDDRRERERAVRRDERQRVRRRQLLLASRCSEPSPPWPGPTAASGSRARTRSGRDPSEVLDERQQRRAGSARPMSHITITLRGRTGRRARRRRCRAGSRAARASTITRLTAAPELSETRAAIARIATSPIQSPRLETTCASQSRKNDCVPNTRHGAGGIGGSSASGGMNGAPGLPVARRPSSALRAQSAGCWISLRGRRRMPSRPRSWPSCASPSSSWPWPWRLLRRLLGGLLGRGFFVAVFLAALFVARFVRRARALLARAAARPPASSVTASGIDATRHRRVDRCRR